MAKSKSPAICHQQARLGRLFERADKQWSAGKLKSAFRLFLAAAKGGDFACQVNLGTFYCDGIGVRPNRKLALYWYRRAYRQGYGPAAQCIGILFRDEGKPRRAIAWLERAAKLGDGDANLDIAKIYLVGGDRTKAIRYLRRTSRAKANEVTEASRKEAEGLLKQAERNGQSAPASGVTRTPGKKSRASTGYLSGFCVFNASAMTDSRSPRDHAS